MKKFFLAKFSFDGVLLIVTIVGAIYGYADMKATVTQHTSALVTLTTKMEEMDKTLVAHSVSIAELHTLLIEKQNKH